jgi:hypothetical protein
LDLKEVNGVNITLTKFLAGGNDFSNTLDQWFGSKQLPAGGKLQTAICWQLDGPFPESLDFEVDGTDSSGKPVAATLTVQFQSNNLNTPSGLRDPQMHSGAAAKMPALASQAGSSRRSVGR